MGTSLFLFAATQPAYALGGFVSGRLLLEMCTEAEGVKKPSCMGYVAGVLDTLFSNGKEGLRVCLPLEGSGTQRAQEIVAMLQLYEGDLEKLNPTDLIIEVYSQMYPC